MLGDMFRVWSQDREEWVRGTLFLHHRGTVWTVHDSGIKKLEGNYLVEMNTGLVDNEGKSVFQGDTVVFDDYSIFEGEAQEYTNIGVVMWSKEEAMFYVTNREQVPMCELFAEKRFKGKVIGNTKENLAPRKI